MNMLVHQAVYGERNQGHALISASAGKNSFFKELTPYTDLPGMSPPNTPWEPYVSAYVRQQNFILSKTFLDSKAPRPGMVRTHALLLKLEDAVRLEDLNLLLWLLPDTPRYGNDISLDAVELEISLRDERTRSDISHTPGIESVAHALVNNTNGRQPVVWIGQKGFIETVTRLWKNLWPEARENFSFGFSFGPPDVEHRNLTLVATPEKLENRWHGFPIVHYSDQMTPDSLAEMFLLGLPEGEALACFFAELDATLERISDSKMLERCHGYFTALEKADANAVLALMRLLCRLSPDPNKGRAIKEKVPARFIERMKAGGSSTLLGLRNLDTRPFRNASNLLEKTVTPWIHANIRKSADQDARENAALINAAFAPHNPVWNEAVLKPVAEALADGKTEMAPVLWTWWQSERALVEKLDAMIPKHREVERALAEKCPAQLPEDLGKNLCAFATQRKWYCLHAAAASAFLAPAAAFYEQLRVDKDNTHLDGLRLLSGKVPAEETLAIALSGTDERLFRIAGERCSRHPVLFSRLDVREKAWRMIWLHSIEKSNSFWQGVGEPEKIIPILMDLVLEGKLIEDALLLKLAATQHGNLIEYPRRSEVWAKLDKRVADAFLRTTAEGWTERFRTTPGFETTVERPLEDMIFNTVAFQEKLLDASQPNALSIGIALFSYFNRLTQYTFRDWLRNILDNHPRINQVDALLLGELVRRNRWRLAARLFYDCFYKDRIDLKPALEKCLDMFSGFEHFFLKIYMYKDGVSEDDWWKALTDVVTELYPHGVEEEKIWNRADGESQLVNTQKEGISQWESALNTLRKGGGGEQITPSKLLKEMTDDYPRNEKLKILGELQWKI
ncbi:MAG: hypothetical protein GY862_04650 [Gammaproteobacteria bacterium]|nr:hypothetical protein [Gammaproteobacteria bacterium]